MGHSTVDSNEAREMRKLSFGRKGEKKNRAALSF